MAAIALEQNEAMLVGPVVDNRSRIAQLVDGLPRLTH
jgi:hypothetical protein